MSMYVYCIFSVEDVKMRATTLRTQFTKLLKPKPSGSGEKGLTQKQRWLLSRAGRYGPKNYHDNYFHIGRYR